MKELKAKINEELQRRVEFIGASLVFTSLDINLSELISLFQKFSEPSYGNVINYWEGEFELNEDIEIASIDCCFAITARS